MSNSSIITSVFDGHNDLVLRLISGQVTAEEVTAGLSDGHIDKPRAIKGGFGGGMFAIFVPSPDDKVERHEEMCKPAYDIDLPESLDEDFALDWTKRGFDALDALEQAGAISLCRTVSEIETVLPSDKIAAVTHIEGAEAIDRDFEHLHEFHTLGLRSLGPVWSRDTVWGHGVPFRYPSDPDIGPGLTEAGIALVKECNRLKILVDLSHLNEKGFNDVARITDAPLVATHSNAWSVTPHSRNLTDRQLDMIRDSDGMVGINFASAFLRPDGQMDDNFNLDIVLRHFDHLINRLGESRVGLGSDFDGAIVPKQIKDCAGLPKLLSALAKHGVDTDLIAKIAHRNWLRVLRMTWN